MRDLSSNITQDQKGIHAVAIGTTGTGKTTGAINLAANGGYNRVSFVVDYGTITATNAVFTALLTESDTTGGSFTSVADADMVGTELLVGVAATTPRTSGVSKNVSKRLGYIGQKQYVKLKVSSTITAGTPISIIPLLSSPRNAPTT